MLGIRQGGAVDVCRIGKQRAPVSQTLRSFIPTPWMTAADSRSNSLGAHAVRAHLGKCDFRQTIYRPVIPRSSAARKLPIPWTRNGREPAHGRCRALRYSDLRADHRMAFVRTLW